jgi:hypothetical protein
MGLCLFFVVLNQFQVWQVSKGMMSSEEGNRAYYWALFGKAKMTEEMLIAADTQLAQPKRNGLDSLGVLWSYADTLAAYPDGVKLLPAHSDRVVEVQLSDLPIQRGDYVRISVEALSKGWTSNRWGMATITAHLSHEGKPYRWKWNRINNKLGNPEWNLYGGQPDVWGEAWYFYKIPRQYKPGDVLHVFLSNPSHLDMYIRSFQVEHWR